jgi:protease-4
MSPEQREVINAILDEYFTRMTNGIAEARKKSVEDVKAIIDNAPYHAGEAQQLGLIDGASYRDQVYEDLKNRLGYKADDKLRTVSGNEYREIPSDSLGLNNGERIAVIYASGAINVGRSSNSAFGGEMVGSDTIVKAVNEAAEDSQSKRLF